MSAAEHSFKVGHAFGEWFVNVKDPAGKHVGRYNGFDCQVDAEEWAAQFCEFLDTQKRGLAILEAVRK